MEKQHVFDQIPDYLDGNLSKSEASVFEKHVENCADCQKELEEMQAFLNVMDKEVHTPSDKLKANFEAALEQEKQHQRKVVQLKSKSSSNWTGNVLKIAASIALLVASFQMGSLFQQRKVDASIAQLQDETNQMKQTAMLSLMENQSASKRIQGVNYIEEFERPDEAIIQALANRLLYDENDNVRMTAFEALAKFTSSETVKNTLIEALENEKNPSIQVAVIQALVQIQEKKAAEPMKKLLDKEDTQPFIKDQIKAVLPSLT
ncbi:HEAT repeat domain-containing protein [Flagellimonas zhangzhouensis]|uniref:Putative zinc-finger n=1 Tax=Flagellimonas zhangzhouensis TaxID=1073328 RepID=A0A1H2UDA9_9FLAO|nr:HEAT repeat domain-containing protein [Allomuricauda zhangzhouensis]SDQ18488.1 Putative zinc-finger [Allomuricauda zhangzhouensis]SDW53444.1 Putative zinc-finger [Allomuricauda zhangzhouensis]